MTITINQFHDMYHIGSIIRNKDLLSYNYNVHINIPRSAQKQGGSNGRTYQMIQIIGSNPNIIKLQKAINIIEIQAENDYLEHRERKRKRQQHQSCASQRNREIRHDGVLNNIIKNERSMKNNPFYGL